MATPFSIVRELELPSSLAANTMYIINESGNLAHIVFTGNTVESVASTYSRGSALTDITAAIADAKSVYVISEYSSLAEIHPDVDSIAYVKDTTGDEGAVTPTAAYVYDVTTSTWNRLPGASGNQPIDVIWSQIIGRPTASVAAIDQAVANSHTHENADVLDDLGADEDEQLTFRGVAVSPVTFVAEW